MGLEDIANVIISTTGAGPTRQGFGVPLVLSTKTAAFAGGRLLTFSNPAAMLTSGFLATDPEYKAVSAMYAQNPAPIKVMVGLLNNKPTQRFTLTPTAVDSTKYEVVFNGISKGTFTSGVGTTATLIATGLKTAIDALAIPGVTTAVVGATLQITAALGAFIDLEPSGGQGFGGLSMVEDNADPGFAADLGALLLIDSNTWYAVVSPWASTAINTAIASWVEANARIFIAHTVDGAVPTAGTSDIASAMKSAAYARTALLWHSRSGAQADAAWAGKCLPFDPGSETWKFKTLNGVPLVSGGLTDSMQTFIRSKNANFLQQVAGINITEDGVSPAGEFIDIVRGRDWLKNTIQTNVFSKLLGSPKIPYTDEGASQIQGVILNVLFAAVRSGFLAATPQPTATFLPVAQQLLADRQTRYMPNINFSGVMAGAIHKLAINGVLTV